MCCQEPDTTTLPDIYRSISRTETWRLHQNWAHMLSISRHNTASTADVLPAGDALRTLWTPDLDTLTSPDGFRPVLRTRAFAPAFKLRVSTDKSYPYIAARAFHASSWWCIPSRSVFTSRLSLSARTYMHVLAAAHTLEKVRIFRACHAITV